MFYYNYHKKLIILIYSKLFKKIQQVKNPLEADIGEG